MAEQIERPQINELSRFTLWAKNPSLAEGARTCKLAFTVRDNCPRVTVYTNDPADANNNYGIINAPTNPESFYIFLNEFEKLIEGPNGKKIELVCRSRQWDQITNKPGDMYELSKLLAGKDDNGICWISVIAKDRPKIKFEILLSEYHDFIKSDGEKLTKEEGSVLQAKSLIYLLKNVYISHINGFRQKRTPQLQPNPIPNKNDGTGVSQSIDFDDDVNF